MLSLTPPSSGHDRLLVLGLFSHAGHSYKLARLRQKLLLATYPIGLFRLMVVSLLATAFLVFRYHLPHTGPADLPPLPTYASSSHPPFFPPTPLLPATLWPASCITGVVRAGNS